MVWINPGLAMVVMIPPRVTLRAVFKFIKETGRRRQAVQELLAAMTARKIFRSPNGSAINIPSFYSPIC